MNDKFCSEGHVIEEERETCSRCNGLPVNSGESIMDTEVTAEVAEDTTVEETAKVEKTDEELAVEDTTASTEEKKSTDSLEQSSNGSETEALG